MFCKVSNHFFETKKLSGFDKECKTNCQDFICSGSGLLNFFRYFPNVRKFSDAQKNCGIICKTSRISFYLWGPEK